MVCLHVSEIIDVTGSAATGSAWFAYLHFFSTYFLLGTSLGRQFKSLIGGGEDFPTVQLMLSGNQILADLGIALM